MDVVDYLRALLRRWQVIAAVVAVAAVAARAVAAVAALVTAPTSAERSTGQLGTLYTATTTLLRTPSLTTTPVDLGLVRLYAKTGEVPRRAAKELRFDGPPAALAARVSVGGDDQVGTLTIGVTDPNGGEAVKVAEIFARQTLGFLKDTAEDQRKAAIESTQETLDGINEQLVDLTNEVAGSSGTRAEVLTAQRQALLTQYETVFARLTELTTSTGDVAPFTVLEEAQPVPLSSGPTLQAPQERAPRLLLGILAGLVLGAAGALLVERIDTRLQDRETAEIAFGLPVVSEIPRLPAVWRHGSRVITVEEPESAAAEAYRGLRAALLLMPSRRLAPTGSAEGDRAPGRAQVVLITAPTARTGKTTTAVNLAACLAETGRRVLLLDADLRNPAVHGFVGVANEVGLSDIAAVGEAAQLSKVIRETNLARTSVVTAGRLREGSGALGSGLSDVVEQARSLADVVVIDSAPMLSSSDALDVMPHVDTVVMVGRARRTTQDQAQRSRELLARLGVPVLGVTLTAVGGGHTGASWTALMTRLSTTFVKAPSAPRPRRRSQTRPADELPRHLASGGRR
jgi:capsular exopolysaccharide synthesis family protein